MSMIPGGPEEVNVCPECLMPVEGAKPVGLWTGYNKRTGRAVSGTTYRAICKKCGKELESNVEAGPEQDYIWEVYEPPPKRPSFVEESREREAVLKPLLQANAVRDQVIGSLGLQFVDFSVCSSRRPELQKWLFFDQVSDAAERYPGILFHVNEITMTWLFFDSEGRLQGYYIRTA